MNVAALLLLLLLAVPAAAGIYTPELPYLTWGATYTGSTASVSASIYDEPYEIQTNLVTDTVFVGSLAPLKEWSLSVVATGGATTWDAGIEVSNDDATWTRILRHKKEDGSGTMVWADHKTARRARLTVYRVGSGTHVSATGYAKP